MSAPAPEPAPTPADDAATVQALVAACIEALERGETDPAPAACAARPDLLPRVRRRLAQLQARGLLDAAVPAPPAAIGPYRVVRELGSGGMGAVYLAEQTAPVHRQVAVKVIKLGMDTREVVARFAAERQALARMNHPHIAQVFDAGATADGRPFFAMEYVPGQPLAECCDARHLDAAARVRLLATVCRAVQHAHDRGFLHRDLKPSNVLVVEHQGQLVPKIIDFGIAKATAPGDEGLRTRADQVLGTPEYMSPEQARSAGLDVDTRTDVYSLGAILYELLCGELPFGSARLRRAPWSELERILAEELPPPPSRRLREAGPATLAARGLGRTSTTRPRLAGELDWITLKALAKARDERYPSALALAEDLERWLRHEPVLAAPPGRTYRLRKFVRRHRLAVGAAAAVLLSLVGGLLVSLRATAAAVAAQQREAAALGDVRAFYDLARNAVGNLVATADEELAEVPQADPVRRRMLADAIDFYTALRAQQPQAAELRLDLATATERIGTLQRQLGQPEAGLATLRQCRDDLAALRRELGDSPRLLQLVAQTAAALGRAEIGLGHRDAARATWQEALAALAALQALPDAPPTAALQANLLANLALLEDAPAAAIAGFEAALAAHERAAAAAPADPALPRERSRCEAQFAAALTRSGQLDRAAAVLQAATARLGNAPPTQAVGWREAEAKLHDQSAEVLHRLGRRDEAAAAHRRAIALDEALAAEHPDLPEHLGRAAVGWQALARLAHEQDRLDEAIAHAGRAVALRRQLVERFAADHRQATGLARALLLRAEFEIARWQRHGGDDAAPTATLREAVAVADPLLAAHGADRLVATTHAAVHLATAALAEHRGDAAAARRTLDAVRAALQHTAARHPDDVETTYQLAYVGNQLALLHLKAGAGDRGGAAGEQGLAELRRGLQLDVRHQPLLDLAPQLAARTAAAWFAADAPERAFAALEWLATAPQLEPAAAETGALLFGHHAQRLAAAAGPDAAPLAAAERLLRAALQRRAGAAPATARAAPRDLDLRVLLARVLDSRGALAEDPPLVAALAQALAAQPDLDAERVRAAGALVAEQALARGDRAMALATAERIAAAAAAEPQSSFVAAAVFTRASAAAGDPQEAERCAARAVECLRRGRASGRLPAAALDAEEFAPLQGRADFAALPR